MVLSPPCGDQFSKTPSTRRCDEWLKWIGDRGPDFNQVMFIKQLNEPSANICQLIDGCPDIDTGYQVE